MEIKAKSTNEEIRKNITLKVQTSFSSLIKYEYYIEKEEDEIMEELEKDLLPSGVLKTILKEFLLPKNFNDEKFRIWFLENYPEELETEEKKVLNIFLIRNDETEILKKLTMFSDPKMFCVERVIELTDRPFFSFRRSNEYVKKKAQKIREERNKKEKISIQTKKGPLH